MPRRTSRSIVLAAAVATCPLAQTHLELRPGDHVAILGYSLPDRMQHTGWLEALIHARFPAHRLVVRTLAVAGDEVATWHRSQDFGSRDEWLAKVEADVILAFYGFNESFAGAAGLAKFRRDLDAFVRHTTSRAYCEKGPPRLVLLSPIACERHRDPAFADPRPSNANLRLYSAALAEVAKERGVPCVDLMAPSEALYAAASAEGRSLTVDGMHLCDDGDRLLAPAIYRGLFGEAPPDGDLARLRAAVLDKSWQWHQRYRTIDGYNVYGGRSHLKFAPKDAEGKTGEPIDNRTVLQREMQIRDVMTKNRDERVWAVAAGGDLVVKDDNLPAEVPVATNHPGDQPDLSWEYPDGEAVIAKLKIAPHCRVNLFADEKRFAELVNPVQMAWDARGRLWVAVWPNYPERKPESTRGDSLLVLEDKDGDGKADVCTHFADDLNAPTGFTFYRDGVLLMQAPDLWYLRDTDGDGRADTKERVVMGIDSADSHHTTNAMGLDPALGTYLSDGVFHRTQIETARGPLRHADSCMWRYEPRTGKVELYAPYEFVNPHGKAWDEWGNDLLTNATDNQTFFGPAISGRLDSGKHPDLKEFWKRPSRPCPGTGIVSSAHFPADWQGNFLNLNVIGLQAITRVRVLQDGSGLRGETVEHVVSADPKELPTFRPVCVGNGPDGALYFCDWAQSIIGHMQHHIRDPNRDHEHGRIYRITYEGRPLATPPKIAGQKIEALLELLKSEVQDTRTLAKLKLGTRAPGEVVAALGKWLAALDPNDARCEHHATEALWLCQSLDVVDEALLRRVLRSPRPEARAAATKVLCAWRERVPEALALLLALATDPDPRVRLHAVRAASFFSGTDREKAARVAFASLALPGDYWLDYVLGETLRQLRSLGGTVLLPDDPKLLATYAPRIPDTDLAKAPDSALVLQERLERKSTEAARRALALEGLVELEKSDAAAVLLAALQRLDAKAGRGAVDEVARLLAAEPQPRLARARQELADLAARSKHVPVRRACLSVLVAADGRPDTVLADAKGKPALLLDVVAAVPLVATPALRAGFEDTLRAAVADPGAAQALRAAALRALPLMPAEHARASSELLAGALRDGLARADAARALLQMPRASWSAPSAAAAAEAVAAWAAATPAAARTKQDWLEVTQCASELAGLMPAADAARLRKQLRELGVAVHVLHAVQEQMRYDRNLLVVEAKKPFEIALVNDDFMPHNLAVVKPGARIRVGVASTVLPADRLDAKGRAYLPDTPDILAATRLVGPGQKETLQVAAIEQEGEYEYVCTVPGHYPVMWGTLVVTADVDAWRAAHPDAGNEPQGGGHEHVHGK